MRVLVVRISSMGDVVHTLPALTDAARAIPEARFDWAVDEAFAQIPAWHPNVANVIPTAYRRWGRTMPAALFSDEFKLFRRTLRAESYDFIVDLQGEFKSALVARFARGLRCGYTWRSAHEWGAPFAYQRKVFVPGHAHSIQRMRRLLARVLGYSYDESQVDYGIDRKRLPSLPLEFPEPYMVFIHSTSWESKNWPEAYWCRLTEKAVEAGFHVVLPWGNHREQERSQRISGGLNNVTVLPRLSISQKAAIIAGAVATVGCDTGLSHIAAALDVPSVTLYGATDPILVGATGKHQIHVASEFECVKCHEVKCSYNRPAEFKPACFVDLRPDRVWTELRQLVTASKLSLVST